MADNRPINVVKIDDSSDEDEGAPGTGPRDRLSGHAPSSVAVTTDTGYAAQRLESRSFWKAGGFDVGPAKFVPGQDELEHARVHPKFLHSNATSHKWAFGAIAELLDNAVDEVPNGATFVKVDKTVNKRDNAPALLFLDDGGGMDPAGMRKCMSLGYSSKKANKSIGQYGNGFKTSTMRLGADAIVFSRSNRSGKATQSVGLLSYTFLRKTGQDDVIVPMIDFDISKHWAQPIVYGSLDDWTANLKIILEWSPYSSKEELMSQFDDIGSHGTKIVIFNLWLNDEGIYELSFDDDDEDLRLRDETCHESLSKPRKKRKFELLQSHISYRIRFSLRAYASLLYLRPFENFQIILRGKPVERFDIVDELKCRQTLTYKPQLASSSEEVLVKTTIGFIKEAPELHVNGFNVYNRNRLIRPFWRVTADGSSQGTGVVGVLEANFLEPTHDKQDFERSPLFIRLESRLKQMIMDYWRKNCHFVGYQPYGVRKSQPSSSAMQQPATHLSGAADQQSGNAESPGESSANTRNVHSLQPMTMFADGHSPVLSPSPVLSMQKSSYASIDQVLDENITLFMRCEEYTQQENELKQTVAKLEKELLDTKRKTEQLAAHIMARKKQSMGGI